ncbi:MAG: RNA polymerase sigma factor [Pseudomonadota bacterium]|nr:RNA polymerase sigma factor [Pseudomonadota bacterium]
MRQRTAGFAGRSSQGARGSASGLFEALTLPHLDRLLAAARILVGSVELAEDLVQEAYIKAWEGFESLTDVERVYGWLYRIMKHEVADYYRKYQRRQALHPVVPLEEHYEEAVGLDDEPFEQLSRELEREEFARLLERLSPDFAEALLLHDLEGLKYREIAEILGVAPGTIMSRIHRARATLIGWVMHEGKTRGVARVAGKEERA